MQQYVIQQTFIQHRKFYENTHSINDTKEKKLDN